VSEPPAVQASRRTSALPAFAQQRPRASRCLRSRAKDRQPLPLRPPRGCHAGCLREPLRAGLSRRLLSASPPRTRKEAAAAPGPCSLSTQQR
jgi:hypothetical protein